MAQNEEAERKEAIEAFADELLDNGPLDVDGINLGSEDQYYVLSMDDWVLDEVNDILNENGMNLVVDHGQVILETF